MTTAFVRQLGRFEPEVYQALAAAGDVEEARARIEAMAGPSGFMLFGTNDHGALLRLAGQRRKAVQYVVGNPLFALQMTRHDLRASLYAPLRVLIYENEEGRTCVEYDRPSSLFGQFGDERISPTAAMLDRKLEALVAAAFEQGEGVRPASRRCRGSRFLLLCHALQLDEDKSVSGLSLEFGGPLGGVFAPDVDAQPELPVLHGVDPGYDRPLPAPVHGRQVDGRGRFAGVHRERGLAPLAVRLDLESVRLDDDLRFPRHVVCRLLPVGFAIDRLPCSLQISLGGIRTRFFGNHQGRHEAECGAEEQHATPHG